MANIFNLAGKTALVTGCKRGIGKEQHTKVKNNRGKKLNTSYEKQRVKLHCLTCDEKQNLIQPEGRPQKQKYPKPEIGFTVYFQRIGQLQQRKQNQWTIDKYHDETV